MKRCFYVFFTVMTLLVWGSNSYAKDLLDKDVQWSMSSGTLSIKATYSGEVPQIFSESNWEGYWSSQFAKEGIDLGKVKEIKINSVKMPENMKGFFTAFYNLESISVSNATFQYVRDMTSLCEGCTKLVSITGTISSLESLESLDKAFKNCQSLTTVPTLFATNTFGHTLRTVNSMFEGCTLLGSVNLNWADTAISDAWMLFSGCSNIKEIKWVCGNNSVDVTLDNFINRCGVVDVLYLGGISNVDNTSQTWFDGESTKVKELKISGGSIRLPNMHTAIFADSSGSLCDANLRVGSKGSTGVTTLYGGWLTYKVSLKEYLDNEKVTKVVDLWDSELVTTKDGEGSALSDIAARKYFLFPDPVGFGFFLYTNKDYEDKHKDKRDFEVILSEDSTVIKQLKRKRVFTYLEDGVDTNVKTYWIYEFPITYECNYVLNGSDIAPATNSGRNIDRYMLGDAYYIETYNPMPANYTLSNPRRDYYTFDGWYLDDGTRVTQLGEFHGDNINARWTPIVYKMEYFYNGGSSNGKQLTEYTIEDDLILYYPADRQYYEFSGWYSDSSFSNRVYKMDTSFDKVYAKWTPIMYKISYEKNGGKFVGSYINQSTHATVKLPTNIEKEGYTFVGWHLKKDLSDSAILKVEIVGDTTLYAEWKKIPVESEKGKDKGSSGSKTTEEKKSSSGSKTTEEKKSSSDSKITEEKKTSSDSKSAEEDKGSKTAEGKSSSSSSESSLEGSKVTVSSSIKKASLISVKSKKKGKLNIKIKSVKGVKTEIQISISKKFKSVSQYTTKKFSITKKLKSKKVYYVRARYYKTKNSTVVYGKWSKVKKAKVK